MMILYGACVHQPRRAPNRLAENQNIGAPAQAPGGAMWFSDLPHGQLVRITGG